MASPLRLIKKFKTLQLTLFLIFTTILFIFSSRSKSPVKTNSFGLSKEERTWMEDFFKGIMIQEDAIYTLCGTKPLTRIIINYYTQEDKKAFVEQMTEEQKVNAVWTADYQLAENWEKWMKIRERFPVNRYLLFKKPHPDPKLAMLYFVDILKLAGTLQEYYDLFSRETGIDFDPMEVVLNMEQGSEFWDRVWDKSINNAALIGVLFGYGVKNSFCFQWKGWPSAQFEKIADSIKPRFCSQDMQGGEATIDRLSIPAFASFFDEDEVVEKYTRERDKIKKIYQGQDFLDLTLSKLTGS